MQVFTAHFRLTAIKYDTVPFGYFPAFAGIFIRPAFTGRNTNIRDSFSVRHGAHFRLIA